LNIDTRPVRDYLLKLQQHIVSALETFDGTAFMEDRWQRPEGGEGITRVIEGGRFFERGGVNFSHVFGDKLPPSASAGRPELAGRGFEAMGVSLVLHPRNPYCPTVHMNVRCFVANAPAEANAGAAFSALNDTQAQARSGDFPGASQGGIEEATRQALSGRRGAPAEANTGAAPENRPTWWFGGGMDLTPYYGFEEDVRHFHATCKQAVEPFGADLHPRFKAWCDRYFFLKHRNEARGVGGLFFDDFNELDFAQSFALIRSVGDAFLPAYLPVIERRRDCVYGERERDFQAYRRGRYVEFNLVFDRGTLFGLQSGGRTESILMSMPPEVKWRYAWQPEAGSAEARLYEDFLPVREWV